MIHLIALKCKVWDQGLPKISRNQNQPTQFLGQRKPYRNQNHPTRFLVNGFTNQIVLWSIWNQFDLFLENKNTYESNCCITKNESFEMFQKTIHLKHHLIFTSVVSRM